MTICFHESSPLWAIGCPSGQESAKLVVDAASLGVRESCRVVWCYMSLCKPYSVRARQGMLCGLTKKTIALI